MPRASQRGKFPKWRRGPARDPVPTGSQGAGPPKASAPRISHSHVAPTIQSSQVSLWGAGRRRGSPRTHVLRGAGPAQLLATTGRPLSLPWRRGHGQDRLDSQVPWVPAGRRLRAASPPGLASDEPTHPQGAQRLPPSSRPIASPWPGPIQGRSRCPRGPEGRGTKAPARPAACHSGLRCPLSLQAGGLAGEPPICNKLPPRRSPVTLQLGSA